MKKTHKMNIGGFSFNVEEDAIEALEAYLGTIKETYRGVEGESEIVGDIEERLGELLVQNTTEERVVSINEVNKVKAVMGSFSRIEDEGGSGVKEEPNKKRRLYRDCDNKMIGGVCSGLAAYTDHDVVIFRLVFALVFLAGAILSEAADCDWCEAIPGFAFLAYVLLWICVPAARTVEQKCSMNRKPLSAGEFDASRASRPSEPKKHNGSGLGRVLVVILGVIMIINGLTHLVGCAFIDFIPRIVNNCADLIDDPEAIDVVNTLFSKTVILSLVVTTGLWGIWNILVGVLLSFDLKAPKWRPGLILFVAFVIASMVSAYFLVRAAIDIPTLLTL